MTPPPLELGSGRPTIPSCEHIAGNRKFITKAFELQQQFVSASGLSLFDVTIDLEDGAPVGRETESLDEAIEMLHSPLNTFKQAGVRIHPPTSPWFAPELEKLAKIDASTLAYITIPKVRSLSDLTRASAILRGIGTAKPKPVPFHILIETPEALRAINEIAEAPEVEVLDFGLLDFISDLSGAIPASCMASPDQFEHAVLRRVRTDIVLAALGHGKVPSHSVTIDVRNPSQARDDARRARTEFGFLRMWSVHPAQIPMILEGMSPSDVEVAEAEAIIERGREAKWGPIEHGGRLHDRASYRYYWNVLERSRAMKRT